MKIVNYKRFFIAVIIVLIIIVSITLLIKNIIKTNSKIDYNISKIKIAKGDTLWSIAEKMNDLNLDIRTYVEIIKDINNIKVAEKIKIGEYINIPVKNERLIAGN